MVQVPRRTTIRGPTFIRLLASLTDDDVSPPRQSLSERLGRWIDWTHAVALAAALDAKPPATVSDADAAGSDGADEYARVRASLAGAIAGDRAFCAERQASDYAFYRQRCLAMQQSMEANIGHLRGRLRETLAAGAPGMARLAAVDAVMERALVRRERVLSSAVPALLGKHFERLRQAAQDAPAGAQAPADAPAATREAWLEAFRKDMQGVLLAELDVRLQPVEGLLAALRTH